jgi:opacity protein-like surface antigen
MAGACLGLLVLVGTVPPALAEDSDQLRWYFHFKARDTNNLTGVHDYYGFGLGANINRYVGFELSGDRFELFPSIRGLGTIGEYGVFALMPQVRLRYPLFRDRLVPYLIGGAGIALTDFNDRKVPTNTVDRPVSALGMKIEDESTTPVGTVGAGIEYFLADNIAFGVEFKYLFARDQTLRVGGVPHTFNASTPLTSLGLRMFYPELHPTVLADARDPVPTRLYIGARLGVAIPTDTTLAPGIEAWPVPAALGGELAQLFSLGVGLDLGRHFGVELGAEGYEVAMNVGGLGTIGEYAVYGFIPQARFRYPVASGRVVPYGAVGVGLVHAEFNDRKPPGANVAVDAVSNSVGASVGTGIEYFVTSNIAFGVEAKYVYSPGHPIRINGHSETATLQAMLVSIGLRAYLAEFGH